MQRYSNPDRWVYTTLFDILSKISYWELHSNKLLWSVRIDGWAIMYRASSSRGQTTGSKGFAYTCHIWSIFLIPSWPVFVFKKSNRGASYGNEIFSTLVPTQFSARAIRFHSRTKKVQAAMCSIFLLRRIISARNFYAWEESALSPSVNFNTIYCFSDADILLEPFLFDVNFDHI